MSPRPSGRDPELTGLPGTRLRWVTIAVAGAGADARLVRGGVLGISVGVEKARSAGCAGLRHRPCEALRGYSKGCS